MKILRKWPVYWVNYYFKGYKRLFKCVRWKEQDFVSALAGNRPLLLLELSSQCPPCGCQSLTVTWIRISRSIALLNYRDSLNEAVSIAKYLKLHCKDKARQNKHPSWIHDRHSRRDNDCSGGYVLIDATVWYSVQREGLFNRRGISEQTVWR